MSLGKPRNIHEWGLSLGHKSTNRLCRSGLLRSASTRADSAKNLEGRAYDPRLPSVASAYRGRPETLMLSCRSVGLPLRLMLRRSIYGVQPAPRVSGSGAAGSGAGLVRSMKQ